MIINSYTPRCSSDDPLPDNLLGMHIKGYPTINLFGTRSSKARGMASEFMILLFLTLVVAHSEAMPRRPMSNDDSSQDEPSDDLCESTCDELAEGNL